MRIAGESNHAKLVFDVVPYRIYETYTLEEFLELTMSVDILISEVATIRRFLGLGDRNEKIDNTTVEETAKTLTERSKFRNVVLRYGHSGCDKQYVLKNGSLSEAPHPDDHNAQTAAGMTGFGDKMTLELLRKWHPPRKIP